MKNFTRNYYIAIAFIFLILFIGYKIHGSTQRPSNVNEELYGDAMSIVNVADLYIEGTIDGEEALKRIEGTNYKLNINEDVTSEWLIGSIVWRLESALKTNDQSDVVSCRKDLAISINYKK